MKSVNKREIIANVIFCVLFFSSSGNCAFSFECVQNLENKAVYEGQLNTVMSLYVNPQNVSWTLKPILQENYTYTIVNYGSAWNQSMTDLYAVNQTGLIIKEATITGGRMSTAGLYNGKCSSNTNIPGAKLLIVRSGPLCSCRSVLVTRPPYVNVSCNVSFADSRLNPIQPILTWRFKGMNVNSSTLQRFTIDQYLYGATSSILANSSDAENYECELKFAAPADNQNQLLAMNAPFFSASCYGCGAIATTASPLPTTIITGSYSSGSLTRKPINTVDVDGSSNITLDCASSYGSVRIGWSFTPLGSNISETIQISEGDFLLQNNHRNYELHATTSSIALIVRQLSKLTEGTYVCHDGTENATALLLIIPLRILLEPLFGPVAGGTNITITGSNKTVAFISTFVGSLIPDITGVRTVYIGYDLFFAKIDNSSFPIELVVGTPNTTETLIRQPLPIIIEFSPNPFNLTFNRAFTYLPNPEIASVYPKQFIVDGGTLLDVTGGSLSSVAVPIIQLTLVISRTTNNSSTPNMSTIITTRVCTTMNDSFMQCPMPTLNLPNDILEIINSGYNKSTSRRRRDLNSIDQFTENHRKIHSRFKRDVNGVLSVNGSNGVDRVDVYVGFILDGYQKYRNINDQYPETTFFFCSGPVINSSKDLQEFDPNDDEPIRVKGSNLQRCSILRDYVVHIGDQICTNSDITDSQLSCRPPKEKPSSTENDTKYCDQYLSISITLGNKQYQYACLTYTDRSSAKTFGLIVGLTVGLCGLGIFLTILITCILTCRRRKQSAVTDGHRSNGRGTHPYSDVVVSGETHPAYNGNYINADQLRLDDDEFGRPGQLPGSYPKPTDDNYLTSTA